MKRKNKLKQNKANSSSLPCGIATTPYTKRYPLLRKFNLIKNNENIE